MLVPGVLSICVPINLRQKYVAGSKILLFYRDGERDWGKEMCLCYESLKCGCFAITSPFLHLMAICHIQFLFCIEEFMKGLYSFFLKAFIVSFLGLCNLFLPLYCILHRSVFVPSSFSSFASLWIIYSN